MLNNGFEAQAIAWPAKICAKYHAKCLLNYTLAVTIQFYIVLGLLIAAAWSLDTPSIALTLISLAILAGSPGIYFQDRQVLHSKGYHGWQALISRWERFVRYEEDETVAVNKALLLEMEATKCDLWAEYKVPDKIWHKYRSEIIAGTL